jgi:hypothetical protein
MFNENLSCHSKVTAVKVMEEGSRDNMHYPEESSL